MFSTGDIIVYGSSGVYRVAEIGGITIKGCEGKDYYTLEPVFGSGTSYVPVDTSVFMRRVMTADEVNALIDRIPQISCSEFRGSSPRAVREHYSASIKTHDTNELIGMIKQIWEKREHKKLSRIEQQYMEQAENLVNSEFSVALGIPRENVAENIKKRISKIN